MNYTVEITESCEQDLEEIALYISENNPQAAIEFVDKIVDNLEKQLSLMPLSAPLITRQLPEEYLEYQGKLRKLVFKKRTLSYYYVDEKKKRVVVLHTKRSWKPLGL
jgi:plasmid stabilization system protein ParE